MAVFVRRSKAGRTVPIVFVDGEPAKVERARAVLPDTEFTSWDDVAMALERVRDRPARDPVVPESTTLAAYAGTPTPKTLGIEDTSRVLALAAPEGLDGLLAPLPGGAIVGARTSRPDLVLCFVRTQSELRSLWPRATRHGVPLWIFWTKRSASATSDVDQRVVRARALETVGWVDHKIARLDSTWAGLRFAKRGSGRAG